MTLSGWGSHMFLAYWKDFVYHGALNQRARCLKLYLSDSILLLPKPSVSVHCFIFCHNLERAKIPSTGHVDYNLLRFFGSCLDIQDVNIS
jgi:hypothetical protein